MSAEALAAWLSMPSSRVSRKRRGEELPGPFAVAVSASYVLDLGCGNGVPATRLPGATARWD